jgi:multidrug efflux pump subunit AcrA (membrane-fusion protein)
MNAFRSTCAAVVALALLLAGCTDKSTADTPTRPAMVVQVSAGVPVGALFAGEVRARYEPALAFRVSGKIIRREVDVGIMSRRAGCWPAWMRSILSCSWKLHAGRSWLSQL